MRLALYLTAVILLVDAVAVSATGGSSTRMAIEMTGAVTFAWAACQEWGE